MTLTSRFLSSVPDLKTFTAYCRGGASVGCDACTDARSVSYRPRRHLDWLYGIGAVILSYGERHLVRMGAAAKVKFLYTSGESTGPSACNMAVRAETDNTEII